MPRKFLKTANMTSTSDSKSVHENVLSILNDIESNGEDAVRKYSSEFDHFDGNLIVTDEEIEAASRSIPDKLKDDIRFAHDNVRRFAKAQKDTLVEMETEIVPGLVAGQRIIPCQSVGCYVPGGRYSHVASAIMTVTTAVVAGCNHVAVCSPPRRESGVNPAILFTANHCGADVILATGGVQGIASLVFGLFGLPKADLLVGPGNQYVAEAKRIFYGRVGIDMVAGPTDSLILADETADANIVAADLVGQAEHGYNSPVWLVTDNKLLAERVLQLVPEHIESLPQLNKENAEAAWKNFAEVILCENREDMAKVADEYAPEHLTVQADDLDWWLNRLKCYGSLFLGEETTVAFGDKASGPNHVLPTSGAARYTGGLSVHKFLKIVTWQRATREGSRSIAEASARISRLEGMEGHARTADIRLQKYFPGINFDLGTGD